MKRLDEVILERGLAETREQSKALIMAGRVRVNGATVRRAFQPVPPISRVELVPGPKYVSRGGEKLAPAIEEFKISVKDRICADIGASIGGFTDVLLQQGARCVYAVDVGRGQLAWKLRQDPRVVVMEGVNARCLEGFPEVVSFFTVDLSFIGLELVLPRLRELAPKGEFLVLFKPQFQLPQSSVEAGGVVRDEVAVSQALKEFAQWCEAHGLKVRDKQPSVLTGRAGNQEYFLWLQAVSSPGREGS